MLFGYAYSAGLIAAFLKNDGIEHKPHSSGVCMSLYAHGLLAELCPGIRLSIQTCPPVAGPAFAETALMNNLVSGIECGALGYYDTVMRHATPEELFAHITTVRQLLNDDTELAQRVRGA